MPAPPASSVDLSIAVLHSTGFLQACRPSRGARDNSVGEPTGITAILGVADSGDQRQTMVRTPGAAPAATPPRPRWPPAGPGRGPAGRHALPAGGSPGPARPCAG